MACLQGQVAGAVNVCHRIGARLRKTERPLALGRTVCSPAASLRLAVELASVVWAGEQMIHLSAGTALAWCAHTMEQLGHEALPPCHGMKQPGLHWPFWHWMGVCAWSVHLSCLHARWHARCRIPGKPSDSVLWLGLHDTLTGLSSRGFWLLL